MLDKLKYKIKIATAEDVIKADYPLGVGCVIKTPRKWYAAIKRIS